MTSATAAAVQQCPISTQSPPSARLQIHPPTKISLSSITNLPKLTITPLRRRAGGSPASMTSAAATSYATALADVARSTNTLNQTSADVEKLEMIFGDEQILNFFTNPTIADETKLEIADEVSKSWDLQEHVANFVSVVVEAKRMDLMKEIVKEFEAAYNRETETEVAVVTSVVALEQQHLAQVAKGVQKLTGARNVRIKTVIDPSLVAGLTIRYGNSGSKLIDLSVKKQIQGIQKHIHIGDFQFAG